MNIIQKQLFPSFEQELDPLTEKEREFIQIVTLPDLPSQRPSSVTFCRAFNEFAMGKLPQKIHEAMIKKHCRQKLAGHINRDATAIEVYSEIFRIITTQNTCGLLPVSCDLFYDTPDKMLS